MQAAAKICNVLATTTRIGEMVSHLLHVGDAAPVGKEWHITLPSASQSSVNVGLTSTAIKGLNLKVQNLLVVGLLS